MLKVGSSTAVQPPYLAMPASKSLQCLYSPTEGKLQLMMLFCAYFCISKDHSNQIHLSYEQEFPEDWCESTGGKMCLLNRLSSF